MLKTISLILFFIFENIWAWIKLSVFVHRSFSNETCYRIFCLHISNEISRNGTFVIGQFEKNTLRIRQYDKCSQKKKKSCSNIFNIEKKEKNILFWILIRNVHHFHVLKIVFDSLKELALRGRWLSSLVFFHCRLVFVFRSFEFKLLFNSWINVSDLLIYFWVFHATSEFEIISLKL